MPYKRFAEAIIMASKKYKIAYNKKRSGWAHDIFKWEHTIQIDDRIMVDLQKIECFLHLIVFGFKRGQWCKVVEPMDGQYDANILSLVRLSRFFVME